MPNWCTNRLTVRGAADAREAFRTRAGAPPPGPPLLFANLLPMPAELAGQSADGDLPAWYVWRITHWGTKWDLDETTRVSTDPVNGALVYDFDTAWGPPGAWLLAISHQFPTLRFVLTYEEFGNDFTGRFSVAKGEVESREECPSWRHPDVDDRDDDEVVGPLGYVSDPELRHFPGLAPPPASPR